MLIVATGRARGVLRLLSLHIIRTLYIQILLLYVLFLKQRKVLIFHFSGYLMPVKISSGIPLFQNCNVMRAMSRNDIGNGSN